MTILRSCRLCRVARPLGRSLSTSVSLLDGARPPPARDWGTFTPPAPVSGSSAGSLADLASRAGSRPPRGPGRRNEGGEGWGMRGGGDRQRTGGGPRREAGSGPRREGGGERSGNQWDGRRDGQRGQRGDRGDRGGRDQPRGVADGMKKWQRPDSAPAQQAAAAVVDMPAAPASAPAGGEATPAVDADDTSDAPLDDARGRRPARGRERERESRSLLHGSAGPDRERGKKGKDRERDRRQWAVSDDAAPNGGTGGVGAGAKQRQYEAKRARQAERKAKSEDERGRARRGEARPDREVFIGGSTSVAQLAEKFGIKLVRLQRKMEQLGMGEEQRRAGYLLGVDQACDLALEFDLNPVVDEDRGFDIYPIAEPEGVTPPLRPPVVTIMGHVDHGKTTLLDALRHTSVAAGEAGGITQHIGAFSVPLSSLLSATSGGGGSSGGGGDGAQTITFLDTPGHAAFTGMRARGAHVTDIVVLVVAADDGVMPQTREVIELVKAEGDHVGLVVAINKCDKPAVDIVKSALGAEGIHLEEDGGDVPSVRVSGLARTGLDDLIETLATLAEIRDLRARRDGQAQGYVLESRVDKGRGNVATVLVSRGTLRAGASVVAGTTWCRVRQMADSSGRPVREAGPGTPVSLTGWKELPLAGDAILEAVAGEEAAKKCVANRLRDVASRRLAADLDAINARRIEERARALREAEVEAAVKEARGAGASVADALKELGGEADKANEQDEAKELRLVIKGDVSGTVEAVVGSLGGIGNAEARVKIVHTGVGDVAESDIALAEAAGATVIGFSVACPRAVQAAAATAAVPLLLDSVIYRLIDAVRARVAALLPPRIEHRVTGEAVVQQLFEIKVGRKDTKVIAGCRVGNGVISKADAVRVLRGDNRDIVFEGSIETLKHLKKDVAEVRKGTECGIAIEGFAGVKEGDEIVTVQKFEVPREL